MGINNHRADQTDLQIHTLIGFYTLVESLVISVCQPFCRRAKVDQVVILMVKRSFCIVQILFVKGLPIAHLQNGWQTEITKDATNV